MTEKEFLQQLFLLRQDIEACPMLDAFAAQQRDRWASRLGDLLNRRNAAADQLLSVKTWRPYAEHRPNCALWSEYPLVLWNVGDFPADHPGCTCRLSGLLDGSGSPT